MPGKRRPTASKPSPPARASRPRARAARPATPAAGAAGTPYALAAAIASDLDPRTLVERILSIAVASMGARRGILFLGSGDDVGLVPAAALNIAGDEIRAIETVCAGIVAAPGTVVASANAAGDRRLAEIPGVQRGEARSVFCAPLMRRGRALGLLYLDGPSASRRISPESVSRLTELAGLAAVALENARTHAQIVLENRQLRGRLDALAPFRRLPSASPQMDCLYKRAALAAQVDVPVLILGEVGTGKERLARAVHEAGARSLGPFVYCLCDAGRRELMEGLLFGHARNAPPGARRPGRLHDADRGVLYLEEIADLDTELLLKLLRALEEGAVRPIHGLRDERIDVRLISAAGRDLRADVRAGRFPEQLYYRIGAVELRIPPLRERPEDIPLLVDHFVACHLAGREDRRRVRFTPDAIEFLQGLAWRGNERELACLVRRALLVTGRATIDRAAIRRLTAAAEHVAAPAALPGAWPAAQAGPMRTYAEQEREVLREALARAGGNKARAARLLGLHRNTFLRRIRRLSVTLD